MKNELFRIRALIWAILAFAAVIVQWFSNHTGPGFGPEEGTNYWSYFTIQNNALFGVWFLFRMVVSKPHWWGGWPVVRLSLTACGMVTMIVYWVLLAPTVHSTGWTLISDYFLHLVLPLAMLGEWVFDRPRRRATWVSWTMSMVVPLAYCTYTLIRGAVTGWYPYFFIDITHQGVAATLTNIAGLVAFFLILELLLGMLWNQLVRETPESQAAAP